MVGGLGIVHVPASPGQFGQHPAGLGMLLLADGLGNRIVNGVANQVMAEPVLARPGRLKEAGVAPGGERVGKPGRRDASQPGQDIPAEARAQDGRRSQYRTGGLIQFGQPRG